MIKAPHYFLRGAFLTKRTIKCPAVKNGRIVGEAGQGQSIRLTSVQPMEIVKSLENRDEILRSRRSFKTTLSKLTGVSKSDTAVGEMERIFAWMNHCMMGFGVTCEKDTWPFWAWHSSAGVTFDHDYVIGRQKTIGNAVFLELEVPREFVILSDYMLFEVVMGGTYIASSLEDHKRYFSLIAANQIHKYFDESTGTVEVRKAKAIERWKAEPHAGIPNGWHCAEDDPGRAEIMNSWLRIFDIDPKGTPFIPSYISTASAFTLQATMPFLRAEWVKSVTEL